jgi:negative regulator of flagellin synthesis FlgM
MIVSGQQVQKILQTQQTAPPKNRAGRADFDIKADKLELSSRAQELKKANDFVLKSPDVRADKIIELKKQINAGAYHRSGAEIAEKMVDRSLADEFAGR